MRLLDRGWRSYLLAHYGKSLLWHASALLFAFFLTETCGLAPRTMGLVLGGSLLVGAVADGVTGFVIRRRIVSADAAARAQRRWMPVVGASFVLFALTAVLPPPVRLAMAALTLLAFRVTYALADVPQNTLVPLIASGTDGRTRLLAARNILSGVASLTVALIGAPILLSAGPQAAPGHLLWAMVVAAVAVASAWRLNVAGRMPAPVARCADSGDEHAARHYTPVLIVTAAVVFASAVFRSMEPYSAIFAGSGLGLMLWASLGAITSQPLWVAVGRRLAPGWPPLLAGLCAAAAAVGALGEARATPVGTAGIGLGFGIGSGGVWLAVWGAAMHRAADGGGTATVGLLTAVSKCAHGVAALWLGAVLDASPYHHTLADPLSPPSLTMSGALAVLALCGGVLAWFSRTSPDEGSARRRPAVPTVRDRAPPRARPSPARAPRVAPEG